MFKVFIAEKILRNIIQTESQRPNNLWSRLSLLFVTSRTLFRHHTPNTTATITLLMVNG